MPDSIHLKRYIGKRINTIIREASTSSVEFTPETFHRLRVEIKKIKALFNLIKFSDHDFKNHEKKYFEPFKALFKKAGKVRKLHIEEELMQRHGLLDNKNQPLNSNKLLLLNQKKLAKAIHNFEKETGQKANAEFEKVGKKIEKHLLKINEYDLEKYNKKGLAEIKENVQQAIGKTLVHELRTDIKRYLYILKLTKPANDKILQATDRLQESIGKWHDGESVVVSLTKIISKISPAKQEGQLRAQNELKKLLKANQNLFQKINKEREKLKKLMNRLE